MTNQEPLTWETFEGHRYYFHMSPVDAVEFRLFDRMDELAGSASTDQMLAFMQAFCKASFRVKTPRGFAVDEDAATNFIRSTDYMLLLGDILVDTTDAEGSLADFIADVAPNPNPPTYRVFKEGNNT